MTLKHINITEINLKLNMQDKNVGFYLDFSIEYVRLVLLIEFRHRQTPRKYEQKKQYSHAGIYTTYKDTTLAVPLTLYTYIQNERCYCLYPLA